MSRRLILAFVAAFIAAGCDAWLGRFDKVTVEIDPRAEEGLPGVDVDGDGADGDGADGGGADGGDADGDDTGDDGTGDDADAGDDGDVDTDAPIIAALTDVATNAQISATATVTDASAFTVQWSQTAGPGVITFGSDDAVTTTISASVDGTYTIEIEAMDANGLTSTQTFQLIWDTVVPANLDAFSGSNGTTTATIDLSWDIPAGPTGADDMDRLVVRRKSGGAAPTDCDDGDVAATFVAPFVAGTINYTDDTDGAGGTFSYRICITDAAGNERSDANETETGLVAKKHVMFVTAQTYDGDLGGLAGADAICQTAGTTSLLAFVNVEPRWRAVLSTSAMDANKHVSMLGIIRAVDDTADIASTYTNFWNGSLVNSVFFDEDGNIGPAKAWTGTEFSGVHSGDSCDDWSDGTAGFDGLVGDTNLDDDRWFDDAPLACNDAATAGIYCLSQYDVQPLDSFTASTSATGSGRIDLEFDMPASMLGYEQLVVRRATGGVAPASCAAGTVVATINDPHHGVVEHVDTGTAGTTYSYRVCVLDGVGNTVAEDTATGVASN
jgi:hypothetical protein